MCQAGPCFGRGVERQESLSDKVTFEQRRQGCDRVSNVNIQPGRQRVQRA